MLNYQQIEALEAVINEESFQRAAHKLRLTQSAISQRIKALEETLGEPLLIRASPPRTTTLGERVLQHLRAVRALENAIDVGKSFHRTTIAIGLNADSLATWFLDTVHHLFPDQDVLLELSIENEDRTFELMQRGLVLGCVSSRKEALAGCDSTRLGDLRYLCVCTPQFRRKFFKDGFTFEAAVRAPAVLFNAYDLVHERFLRKIFHREVPEFPKHLVPSSEAFCRTVEMGLAFGLVAEPQSQPLIERRRLINLAPDEFLSVPLYWHIVRRLPASQSTLARSFAQAAQGLLKRETLRK